VLEHRYRIVVSGGLGDIARQAFEGLKIEPDGENTALMGDLDQAALYGALNRISSLGLELVEVVRLPRT
jgi:hypothetical protein